MSESTFVGVVGASMSRILSTSGLQESGRKRVLVAFSGGPDSTALVIALAQLTDELKIDLYACHVNHGLRGLESDLDQEFCQKLCADLSVEFQAFRLDEAVATKSERVSENLLRELRYRCLLEHAQALDLQLIVTGHTLDDQAETILFRMFRGTSPTGLVGMESLREMVNPRILLARPLLSQTKSDCQRFLAIEQIGAHFDSSNEDAHYARNYIRNQLIPKIDDKFPGWKNRIERLRVTISEQEDWLSAETIRQLEVLRGCDERSEFIDRAGFKTCHIALKRRLVAKMLRDKQIEPSFDRIENVIHTIDELTESALTLSLDWELRVDGDKVRWTSLVQNDEPSDFLSSQEAIIRLPDGEAINRTNIVSWLNKSLNVVRWTRDSEIIFPPPESLEIYVDLGNVSGSLKLRLRQSGDVLQPFGMVEQVRLKKYLHTHKRRSSEFRHTIVLCDDEDVLWVPGVGYSERLRCHPSPTHILRFLDLAHQTESFWV
jgi:tRNA(Ile)-lysidine synthase